MCARIQWKTLENSLVFPRSLQAKTLISFLTDVVWCCVDSILDSNSKIRAKYYDWIILRNIQVSVQMSNFSVCHSLSLFEVWRTVTASHLISHLTSHISTLLLAETLSFSYWDESRRVHLRFNNAIYAADSSLFLMYDHVLSCFQLLERSVMSKEGFA